MNEELKPCPFCGGQPEIKSVTPVTDIRPWDPAFHCGILKDELFSIRCGKCGRLITAYMRMDKAIEDWNMRVDCNTRKLEGEVVVMRNKLKPCPFCGSGAELYRFVCANTFYVGCTDCEVQTPGYSNKFEAIAAWNRRCE